MNERLVLGLVAGDGALPAEIALAASKRGHEVTAIGFHGITNPALADCVDQLEWLYLGEVEALLERLQSAGIRQVVMAGKVTKSHLYSAGRSTGEEPLLRPDGRALELLASLKDRRDDSILRALAELLDGEGIALRSQTEWIPELLPGVGCLGAEKPSAEELADISFGWPIAKQIAALDIGQTVVVKRGAVVALEAIEGTDAALRRGAALGGEGVCVIKVAKPDQDPRFDVPTVGPDTLDVLSETGARVLAFEAHRTILLDRAATLERADRAGIVLMGITDPEESA